MLELAKVAYSHKLEDASEEDKKAVEVKICETLLSLGEVSLESESYEQAVLDITDCLNKRKVGSLTIQIYSQGSLHVTNS